MHEPKKPSKQAVHNWMFRPRDFSKPYQSLEQIRRELGWPLLTTVPNRRGG